MGSHRAEQGSGWKRPWSARQWQQKSELPSLRARLYANATPGRMRTRCVLSISPERLTPIPRCDRSRLPDRFIPARLWITSARSGPLWTLAESVSRSHARFMKRPGPPRRPKRLPAFASEAAGLRQLDASLRPRSGPSQHPPGPRGLAGSVTQQHCPGCNPGPSKCRRSNPASSSGSMPPGPGPRGRHPAGPKRSGRERTQGAPGQGLPARPARPRHVEMGSRSSSGPGPSPPGARSRNGG